MSAIDTQLVTIAQIVQSWLDWQENNRIAVGMTSHPHTALMALPVPLWPDRAQLQAWIDALNAAKARIAELESAPTPLPRPDKPGWWWLWTNEGTPPRWLPVYVSMPEAARDGQWLPATPPPVPKNQPE